MVRMPVIALFMLISCVVMFRCGGNSGASDDGSTLDTNSGDVAPDLASDQMISDIADIDVVDCQAGKAIIELDNGERHCVDANFAKLLVAIQRKTFWRVDPDDGTVADCEVVYKDSYSSGEAIICSGYDWALKDFSPWNTLCLGYDYSLAMCVGVSDAPCDGTSRIRNGKIDVVQADSSGGPRTAINVNYEYSLDSGGSWDTISYVLEESCAADGACNDACLDDPDCVARGSCLVDGKCNSACFYDGDCAVEYWKCDNCAQNCYEEYGACMADTACGEMWFCESYCNYYNQRYNCEDCPGILGGGSEILNKLIECTNETCSCKKKEQIDTPDVAEITWITLPGGTYEMGSNISTDAQPVHTVSLATFDIAKSEVTVAQYAECVTAGVCSPASTLWSSCNWGVADQLPINCVSWNQATSFCTWAGARLCTESEWEYAAKSGGKDQMYPWGSTPATCDYAVMNSNEGYACGGGAGAWGVCSIAAGNTTQGVCDLAGNVWEWVEDCSESSYDGAPVDGSARESCTSNSVKVLRGGSYYEDASKLMATSRYYGPADYGDGDSMGFRCCKSLQ